MAATAPLNNWAILIGIDQYLQDDTNRLDRRTIEGKRMKPPKALNGCVNDALSMRKYLLETMQMDADNILMFLAPQESPHYYSCPLPDEYKAPTYENIVSALADVDRYSNGESLYIHFSGHGAKASTMFPKYRKDSSNIDYCLLPVDVARNNGKFLRDVELGALLQDIARKGVHITVVLDCCHSGTAIRGDEDDDNVSIRGDLQIYSSNAEVDLPLHKASQESINRRGHQADWMTRPDNFVVLTACQPQEKAYETRVSNDNSHIHGSLTFALLDTLRSIPSPLSQSPSEASPNRVNICSADTIYHTVRARVKNEHPNQNPYMFNNKCSFFFGPDHQARMYAVTVREIQNGRVILNGGRLNAIHCHTKYAILVHDHPLDRLVARSDVLATVEVTEVGTDSASTKMIGSQDSISRIRSGCPAVLQELPSCLCRRVLFEATNDAQRRLFSDAWEKGSIRKLLELLGDSLAAVADTRADFTVRIDREGIVQVADSLGMLSPDLAETFNKIPWDNGEGMTRLIRRLEHLASYQIVRRLENPNATRFGETICVAIGPHPDAMIDDDVDVDDGGIDDDNDNNIVEYKVKENSRCRITVTNNSPHSIGFTILDLVPDFGIDFLSEEVKPCYFLDPGRSHSEDVCFRIDSRLKEVLIRNNDLRPVKELIKVVVSRPAYDMSSFYLKSLYDVEDPCKNGTNRGQEVMEGVPDELDEILHMLEDDSRKAYPTTDRGPRRDWVTKDITIKVVPDLTNDGEEYYDAQSET